MPPAEGGGMEIKMNHNDTVKESFKNQDEKVAAYHMSKTEYTDYLMKRIGAKGTETLCKFNL